MTDTYITHSAADYAQAFANELPQGAAWSRDPDNGTIVYTTALAQIWGDVAQAMTDLLFVENNPALTSTMLPDWLDNYNLPDPCLTAAGVTQTTADLQAALIFRIQLQGGASPAFFIALAATLGYDITITEYRLFKCGFAQCGVTQLNDPSMQYQWTVNVGTPALYYFHAGAAQSGVTPLLNYQKAPDLECILKRYKPTHTYLNFNYVPKAID